MQLLLGDFAEQGLNLIFQTKQIIARNLKNLSRLYDIACSRLVNTAFPKRNHTFADLHKFGKFRLRKISFVT